MTTVFGAAASDTATIRVRTDSGGFARSIVPDLRTGAYAAILPGAPWTTEGFSGDGRLLGARHSGSGGTIS